MCGRFTQTSDLDSLKARFKAVTARAEVAPGYNIAPTDRAAVVLGEPSGRVLDALRWGLVPSWAKSLKSGPRPINAKSETAATSGMFKRLLERRRCLVPADGFYEWEGAAGRKRPVRFHLRSGEPFAFAGLWDLWRDPERPGEELRTFTILTTAANDLVRPIHDRMPVILPAADEEAWLDPANGLERACALLRPLDPALMALYLANPAVNDARFKGPECLEPARAAAG